MDWKLSENVLVDLDGLFNAAKGAKVNDVG